MASKRATRKLSTILAADVVGYSRLMAEDEEATLGMLRASKQVFEAFVTKHGGRIVNTAGDAVLAEFASTVEAVRCAVSIQEELSARNAQRAEREQMWFRIGINVGDVMVEDGDLFGDGVNVAARLEALAEKGGICISGSTFEQVKNKLSVAFADIGPQTVKNIPEPVPAFRLVPGQVSVASGDRPTAAQRRRAFAISRPVVLIATLILVAGGVAVWVLTPRSPPPSAFDGRWNIAVHGRSGCLSNEPASYAVLVQNGVIDEPAHRFPKKGTISPDGTFRIEVSNPQGRPMNTQSGTISGDAGEGRFLGSRPGCEGRVTIRRSQ